ncbi:DNA replication/repair protein RecF [Marinoscillum furvescens]|uniref:DNA replication and repair protein RecF n=1 Tax=Marinoscillum furvescens DSM 4134 TaxID=1122208 RepID=A0A3D9L3L6_MARFU|nr:DNA replication and repair protein RecF [Marinoscillum furvescens]RED98870.1 DNA replication and repair protein RecF [Marinoscillum furvescens DSM 4134]
MKLNSLKLTYFKNYDALEANFSSGINCLVGKNGMGKTNLLDALHYLSMTRSALNTVDGQNIQHGESFFAINSVFEVADQELRINCYFEQGKKKVLKVNGKEVDKLSDHIGRLPSVLITPDDTEIIKEGSEVRRKFFDSVIAQHDRSYLEALIQMQRLLKQRNSFLKQNDGKLNINRQLLDVYDEGLLPLFQQIAKRRQAFIEEFTPYFIKNYAQIFEGKETPSIRYRSDVVSEDFELQFKEVFQKDILLQRTTKGAHRDDYVFALNDRAVKKFGSQGQQKSFVIALKLAEYDYLKTLKGLSPLLLLDDIFDKLDDERIHRLVSLLTDEERFSQIFITDARKERSEAFFEGKANVQFYEIHDGQLK